MINEIQPKRKFQNAVQCPFKLDRSKKKKKKRKKKMPLFNVFRSLNPKPMLNKNKKNIFTYFLLGHVFTNNLSSSPPPQLKHPLITCDIVVLVPVLIQRYFSICCFICRFSCDILNRCGSAL